MLNVLVVDDEFGVGEVIEAILTDEGYHVVTAMNGKQGLQRLRETRIDVAIVDVVMPVMDGPAMLQAMRADPALEHIPVIMTSSLDEITVQERAGAFAAFLRKPFRSNTVIELVAHVVRHTSSSS
jgi:CheY-like chemotaxis protein